MPANFLGIVLRSLLRMDDELRSTDFPCLHSLEAICNSIKSVRQDFELVRLKHILVSHLLIELGFAYLDNTILQPLSQNVPSPTTQRLVRPRMGATISRDDRTTLSLFLPDDRLKGRDKRSTLSDNGPGRLLGVW